MPPTPETELDPAGDPVQVRLLRQLDKRWVVLSTVLFGIGIWGLPLLWKSRAFSRGGKVFWTCLFIVGDIIYWIGLWQVAKLLWRGVSWLIWGSAAG